jgi:hypothetical protein
LDYSVLKLKKSNCDTITIKKIGLFLRKGIKYTNLTLQQLLFIADCAKISTNYEYTSQLEYDDFEEIQTSFPFVDAPSTPAYDIKTSVHIDLKKIVDFSVMYRHTFAKNLYNLLPKLCTNEYTQIIPEAKQLLLQYKNTRDILKLPLWTFVRTTLPHFAKIYNKLLNLNRIISNKHAK